MGDFSVDYDMLEQSFVKQAQTPTFKYEDVKHRLKKVAFDIVRFVDADNIDGLWQIQQTSDGDVIVAMYESDELVSESSEDVEKTASGWSALPGKYSDITLFYKDQPVTKISLAKLGMAKESTESVCSVLSEKLAKNEKLLGGLLSTMSSAERKNLLDTFPELEKFVNKR